MEENNSNEFEQYSMIVRAKIDSLTASRERWFELLKDNMEKFEIFEVIMTKISELDKCIANIDHLSQGLGFCNQQADMYRMFKEIVNTRNKD